MAGFHSKDWIEKSMMENIGTLAAKRGALFDVPVLSVTMRLPIVKSW